MRSALLREENRGLRSFNTPSQDRNFDSSVAYYSSSCSIHNGKSSYTQDEDMLEISNKDEDMLEISNKDEDMLEISNKDEDILRFQKS